VRPVGEDLVQVPTGNFELPTTPGLDKYDIRPKMMWFRFVGCDQRARRAGPEASEQNPIAEADAA
jgi:hypothetical protein